MPPLQPPPFNQVWAGKDGRVPAGPVQDFLLAQQQSIVTGAAPSDGRYLVTQTNPDLTNEVNLGALTAGYLHIRVALGVATVVSGFAVSTQASPANPTGTTDTTGVMMGLGGVITPTVTGRILVTVCGTIFNPTAIADGAKVQLRTGTGTAPANGDALAGTAAGGLQQYVAATVAEKAPFSVTAIVSGLTLNAARWIDVSLAAITGGTATITDLSLSAVEV